jgi:hypothetical protein
VKLSRREQDRDARRSASGESADLSSVAAEKALWIFQMTDAPGHRARRRCVVTAAEQRPPQLRALSGNQKDFLSVGIFDFGSGRKSADVNVTGIRRVRARDKARFIRNRNAVGDVALGRFNHSGCSGRLRSRFLDCGLLGGRRPGVLIVRLRRRRVLRWSSGGVFGWPLACRVDWRLIFAGAKKSKRT